MIVCKQCGTVFEEVFQTCPKCGAVYQPENEENYNAPRRRMPGEPDVVSSQAQTMQTTEISLKESKKKKSKAPTVVVIIITLLLMIAVAVTLVVYFSEKNKEAPSGIPQAESEEQLVPPESIPESEPLPEESLSNASINEA